MTTLKPPYRVGIVGIGFGQKVHVPAFRMDPRFEIRTICASTQERAQAAATALKIPHASGDWRKLVADPELDVIAIATPPTLQPDILSAALSHRKHVFLEKPVGGGVRKAIDLARFAKQVGGLTVIDFEFEAIDVWRKAHGLIRQNRLGTLTHAVVTWNVQSSARKLAPGSTWKLNLDAGGGTLNSFVSHTFYYLEWLFGPIQEMNARLHKSDDVDHLNLLMQSGLPISVAVCSNAHSGSGHRLEIYGEKGCITLQNKSADYINNFTLTVQTESAEPEITRSEFDGAGGVDGRILGVARMINKLGDALETGQQPKPGLMEGARVECLIDWARLSERERRWVKTESFFQ